MRALELKVPPLALSVIFAGAMWLASVGLPGWGVAIRWRSALAGLLAGAGAAVAAAGVVAFRRHSTTVNPTQPGSASVIVSSGVYRVSRNPMYLGFALTLAGWSCLLANGAAMLLLAFIAYMNRFQIEPEERALNARFGCQYLAYQKTVRRWI